MNDRDERIRRYLRSRADVPVPGDLRWPPISQSERPKSAGSLFMRSVGLVAAVIVAAVIIRTIAGSVSTTAGPRPTGAADASASPSSMIGGPFPSSVAGMPVVSVARATELLQGGDLDGRAVAVAGYFFQVVMSCPSPQRYYGSLEEWCGFVALTDSAASATLCSYEGDTVACHAPSGTHLAPVFMPETSGALPSASIRTPVPMVVIGHAYDAREWLCGADSQEACARAFVVDRVAWNDGDEVPLTAPDPRDQTTQQRLAPRLSMDRATAALGGGHQVLAAAAMRAADVWLVDPRWNLAGDEIVWIVRSIETDVSDGPETRSVTVSLVDDQSGRLLDAHDLALGAEYQPARLWTIATADTVRCCGGNVEAFYSVSAADGTSLHDGIVQGPRRGFEKATTYGPGAPLVMDPGSYTVTAWLATLEKGVIGSLMKSCSTNITVSQLDDVMLEAHFAGDAQSCTFAPPSAPKLSY